MEERDPNQELVLLLEEFSGHAVKYRRLCYLVLFQSLAIMSFVAGDIYTRVFIPKGRVCPGEPVIIHRAEENRVTT